MHSTAGLCFGRTKVALMGSSMLAAMMVIVPSLAHAQAAANGVESVTVIGIHWYRSVSSKQILIPPVLMVRIKQLVHVVAMILAETLQELVEGGRSLRFPLWIGVFVAREIVL